MKDKNEVNGVIYPIRNHNYKRLLTKSNPIYVKYIPHSNSKNATRLQIGNYIFFYLSKGDKLIIGYSKIKKITFKTSEELIKSSINQIQMDKEEFIHYIQNREEKELLVLELKKIMSLTNSINSPYPISMAGRYVSKEETKKFLYEWGDC